VTSEVVLNSYLNEQPLVATARAIPPTIYPRMIYWKMDEIYQKFFQTAFRQGLIP